MTRTIAENKLGAAAHHCAVEICNCKDDNCNGQIDEGLLPLNACGGPCGCAVPPDVCNGLDDNCDGAIDNGNYPTGAVGTKCNNGLKGACNRDGLLICNASGTRHRLQRAGHHAPGRGVQRHRRQLRRADRRGDAARRG